MSTIMGNPSDASERERPSQELTHGCRTLYPRCLVPVARPDCVSFRISEKDQPSPASSRARARTRNSIGAVSRPVFVF